jgi:Sporulation and spore germination
VAAGAAGWFLARGSEHAVSLGPPRPAAASQAAQRTGAFPSASSFDVWLARDGRLVEALRTHKPTRRVATAALAALLAGPTQSERASGLTTAIPEGTRLLGVTIANGVARVDLTSDFESAAGSRLLQLRLAQVVYTLTQFPTVKAVRFSIDGSPVSVVSGSGNVVGHAVGRDDYRGLAPVVSPLAGSWRTLPPSPFGALTSRAGAWTGKELLLLGRAAGGRTVFAAHTPGRGWRKLSPPRGLGSSFRVAWTGHELIAWGSTVAAYNPASGRWRPLPSPPAPGPPKLMAWTGSELIGWTASGGAAYRPHGGWRSLPKAPLGGASAWTGKKLIVVSGDAAASFSPGHGWHQLPPPPLPRPGARAVWDGDELLLIGGRSAPPVGLAYSPKANAWRELAPTDSGRRDAAAVWTGKQLIVWGGETGAPGGFVIPPHGVAYDPKADRWSPLPQAPLRGRRDPIGVWTGRSLLVWGGEPGFADGASFKPSR